MKKSVILFFILIVISSLLATSCVTRQVPVVETYYETEYKTEYKTEPYTETVDAVISSKQGVSYPDSRARAAPITLTTPLNHRTLKTRYK
jgi:Tfp pilus assembly protein PilP